MQRDNANGRPAAEPERPQPLQQSPSLYFLGSFFVVFCVTVAVLLLLRIVSLPTDVLDDQHRRWAMALLPGDEIAALKLWQAEKEPRYDIGLFGNSRILMVGADELGLGNRRVFNFAIGGQSIRQSIRLLEELRARGKAPAIAVVSMDYVELGLPGGLGVSPGPPWRWLEEAADVWIAWKREGLRSAVVQIINIGSAEEQQMAITFNHFFVLSKLRALAGSAGPPASFRPDGSQKEVIPAGPVTISPLPRRADTYPQLESDFARLAAIRDAGTRVLVYESPVAPQLMSVNDRGLSANARAVRYRFHEACARFQLECHGPPSLTAQAWFNRDHPRAALLAAWLRPLIEQRH